MIGPTIITITGSKNTFSGLDGRQKKLISWRGKRRTDKEFGKEEHQERGGKREKRLEKKERWRKKNKSLRMKRREE
jgi:hypothetical protein